AVLAMIIPGVPRTNDDGIDRQVEVSPARKQSPQGAGERDRGGGHDALENRRKRAQERVKGGQRNPAQGMNQKTLGPGAAIKGQVAAQEENQRGQQGPFVPITESPV